MYEILKNMSTRPRVFSVYSAEKLWTDAHLADQMLKLHLRQDTEMASRPFEAIDRVVDWIDQRVYLEGKSVCDLGCGPGLYTTRYAVRGAIVHGLDFSPTSIEYAKKHQRFTNESIKYEVANYLTAPLPEKQDLITLIYCDLCALSPAQRQTLLRKIRQSLRKNGKFVFDVFSTVAFEDVLEGVSFGRNFMDGFWSSYDYFTFKNTFRYDEEIVSLDHYTVIEENRTWEVYNWLQYFSPDDVIGELRRAGFGKVDFSDGFGVDRSDSSAFSVIASA